MFRCNYHSFPYNLKISLWFPKVHTTAHSQPYFHTTFLQRFPFFAPHQRRVEENIIIIIINFTEISNRMMSTEQMVKLHLHWRVPNGKRAAEEVASIVRASTAAWCKYVSLWRTQNKRFLLFFVQFLCFLQFLPPCVCVSFFTWIFFPRHMHYSQVWQCSCLFYPTNQNLT